jgi:hypothetical protein
MSNFFRDLDSVFDLDTEEANRVGELRFARCESRDTPGAMHHKSRHSNFII